MKKIIINIMFTNSAVLVFLAIYALIINANTMYIRTIFEVLGSNIIFHLGLFITRKFESRYVFFEYLLDIGYLFIVLGIFAFIFKWYASVPIWYIFAIAIVIYLFSALFNIVRTRKSAKKMNELLQKRKNQSANPVT